MLSQLYIILQLTRNMLIYDLQRIMLCLVSCSAQRPWKVQVHLPDSELLLFHYIINSLTAFETSHLYSCDLTCM